MIDTFISYNKLNKEKERLSRGSRKVKVIIMITKRIGYESKRNREDEWHYNEITVEISESCSATGRNALEAILNTINKSVKPFEKPSHCYIHTLDDSNCIAFLFNSIFNTDTLQTELLNEWHYELVDGYMG